MKEGEFGEKQLEELFNLCFKDLMGMVYSFVQDEEVAKDIIQDAFLSIWKNKEDIKYSTLRAFIFTLCRNMALNYLRHQKVIKENHSVLFHIGNEVEEEFQEQELAMASILSKLDELPDKQRDVLYLCFVEGKSYREVSETLDISVNTVKTHVKRGLKFLRGNLPDELILLLLLKKIF